MLRFLLTLTFLTTAFYATSANSSPLEDAKKDISSGRYAHAITTLQSLVEKEQNNYEAWFLFGVAQVHEQKDHQAIEAFRHVIELRPELAEPHNNLAAVYNNLGDTKAAIKELEIALGKRPSYSVAEENLADLYIKMALKHYRSSLNNGASAIIEKRYERLLHVRNPVISNDESSAHKIKQTKPVLPHPTKEVASKITEPLKNRMISEHTEKNDNKANVATKELTPKAPTVPSKTVVALLENNQTPTDAMPSIAEDKSITDVLDALEAWRNAWSSQDLNSYFAAYVNNYQPDKRFKNLKAWKTYKTRVIKNKAFIKVSFDKVEVNIPASRNLATISVLQHFNSNTYNSEDRKVITMKYTPNGWKIVSEVSAK